MGPGATDVDVGLGCWLDLRRKASADLLHTEEGPTNGDNMTYPPGHTIPRYLFDKQHSGGLLSDLLWLARLPAWLPGALLGWNLNSGIELREGLNYQQRATTMRTLSSLSGTPSNRI